jgi:MFS transporter, DHA1 family, multidrug resistance protein
VIKIQLSPFVALCTVGFFARESYAMARTPVLPLFAVSLVARPEAIGFVVGASTITGIFFKLPAGALSDIYGRHKMLLLGVFVFGITPFAYYLVTNYWQLVGIRFFHGPTLFSNYHRYPGFSFVCVQFFSTGKNTHIRQGGLA